MKRKLSFGLMALLMAACVEEQTSLQSTTSTQSSLAQTTASTAAAATTTTIQFSGYTWVVKTSGTSQAGPGPNYWSSSNVWVDSNGWLHLKITKNADNTWSCAEVYSTQNFGYGTYQWKVEGWVNALDKNVVLGLFNYSGNDGYDEMDVEFARWGSTSNGILNYTVYPASSGNPTFHVAQDFTLEGTYTTHRFTRSSSSVVFKSLGGHVNDNTNLFATSTCSSSSYSISTLAMPIHMNLWLYQGLAPSNDTEVEIVIHEFTFSS